MRTFVKRFDFKGLCVDVFVLIRFRSEIHHLYGEPLSKGSEVAVTAPGVSIQNQLKLDLWIGPNSASDSEPTEIVLDSIQFSIILCSIRMEPIQ